MTARVLLVGAAAIAERAGCSERTIRRDYKAGRLPGAFKTGGRTSPIKLRRSDLDDYLKARED